MQQLHALSPSCGPCTVLSLGHSHDNICSPSWQSMERPTINIKVLQGEAGAAVKGGGGQTWSEDQKRFLTRSDISAAEAWRVSRNWSGACLIIPRCPVPAFPGLRRTHPIWHLILALLSQEILHFPWSPLIPPPIMKLRSLSHIVLVRLWISLIVQSSKINILTLPSTAFMNKMSYLFSESFFSPWNMGSFIPSYLLHRHKNKSNNCVIAAGL